MRKMLMLAAALSLLAGPAAMAQHRHGGGGGGGHHAGAARHQGGGHFNNRRAARSSRSFAPRRSFQARHAARSQYRGGRSAYARRAGRNDNRSRYSHARHFNRGVVGHRAGARHWRHVSHSRSWRRGGRLPYGYWRGRPWVNWRAHSLWAPPYGYQWVYVDGSYVLIAIATGLIADIVMGY